MGEPILTKENILWSLMVRCLKKIRKIFFPKKPTEKNFQNVFKFFLWNILEILLPLFTKKIFDSSSITYLIFNLLMYNKESKYIMFSIHFIEKKI